MVEAFKIPLSFDLDANAKSFVEDLKKAVGGVAKKTEKKSSGIGTAIAGGVVGGLIGGGIASLEDFIKKVLSGFKNLTQLTSTIIKVVLEFLRPIADVVMLLLMPVLQILKPILVVVRQIMAPFRQIAFQLSREGAKALGEGDTAKAAGLFGLSIQQGLLGVQAVFGFLTTGILEQLSTLGGEVLKLLTTVIGNLFRPILEFFGVNVDKTIQDINSFIDSGIKTMNDAVRLALGISFSAQQLLIAKLAEQLGVDISEGMTEVNNVLRDKLVGSDNSFIATFDEMTTSFENSLTKFDNVLLGDNGIVAKFEEAANRLDSAGGGGGGISFRGGTSAGNARFLSTIGFQGQSTRSGVIFTRPPASSPF
jgi:hypothetical protein